MSAGFERIAGQWACFQSSEDMSAISSEAVDVIVTSPPYNRGKTYSSDTGARCDDALPNRDYEAFLARVFAELYRVLRSDGVFFLNIGDSARDLGKSESVLATARAAGFEHLQTVIWVKSLLGRGHYTPSGGARRLNNLWENLYILVKDRRAYRLDTSAIGIPYADKSNIGRYGSTDKRDPGNVWLIPYAQTTGASQKKGHDAPYPHELVRRCLALVPGARVVLDPFLGTGVTLSVCRAQGLIGLGYEKFPRRSLIESVISSPPPLHREPALLPHYEKSIALLLGALTELAEPNEIQSWARRKRRSKVGKNSLAILADVLESLDLADPFK